MMKRSIRKALNFFFLLFGMLLLHSQPSHAHSPYAIKDKVLDSASGPLIIERLYGDGIFIADPVSLQVRNQKGAVVAYTTTAHRVALFCPAIEYCWAFPHTFLATLTFFPERLDLKGVDLQKSLDGEPSAALKSYLTDRDVKSLRDDSLNYPEHRKTGPSGFVSSFDGMILLSPIFIAIENVWALLAVFFLSACPKVLYQPFREYVRSLKGFRSIFPTVLMLILEIAYVLAVAVVVVFAGFSLSTPVAYIILFFWFGRKSGKLGEKFWRSLKNTNDADGMKAHKA
jgi:hypothetical protein